MRRMLFSRSNGLEFPASTAAASWTSSTSLVDTEEVALLMFNRLIASKVRGCIRDLAAYQ